MGELALGGGLSGVSGIVGVREKKSGESDNNNDKNRGPNSPACGLRHISLQHAGDVVCVSVLAPGGAVHGGAVRAEASCPQFPFYFRVEVEQRPPVFAA